jgi:hypothetical protein
LNNTFALNTLKPARQWLDAYTLEADLSESK